jgi:hypothetical protein
MMRQRVRSGSSLAAVLLLLLVTVRQPLARPKEEATPSAPAAPGSSDPAPEALGGWFGSPLPLVVPPFVEEFPGVDLKSLTAAGRERFLHRSNTEPCTCGQAGCARHTLAFCLKVDPGCPRARNALRKIVSEILSTGAKTPPGPPVSPPSRMQNPRSAQ